MAKNFYIQGDPSRAKEIKAAFEAKGIDTGNLGFSSSQLYYTIEGKVELMCTKALQNIIKTHPDYQELELPVEHILKVGDWIVPKSYNGEMPRQIVKKLDTVFVIDDGTAYICEDAQKFYRLWTIADAKDGDALVSNFDNNPFIYNGKCEFSCAGDYVGISRNGIIRFDIFPSKCWTSIKGIKPSTKEQRDLFFAKIKEEGYQWDSDKKALNKITKHYDIANFKPKQWVLVRDDDEWEWALTRFSYLSNGSSSLFVCINGASFQQCLPFDGNEHLLGTTDMPSEEFINW